MSLLFIYFSLFDNLLQNKLYNEIIFNKKKHYNMILNNLNQRIN